MTGPSPSFGILVDHDVILANNERLAAWFRRDRRADGADPEIELASGGAATLLVAPGAAPPERELLGVWTRWLRLVAESIHRLTSVTTVRPCVGWAIRNE